MTKEQKDTAIQKMELPPDYLDRFWPIFWGFVPVVLIFTSCFISLILSLTRAVKLPWGFMLFFLIGITQFFLCIYFRVTERRLTLFRTDLDSGINEQIIFDAAKSLGWQIKQEDNYTAIRKPFAFGLNCYLIKTICDNTGIYYNIRTQGTYKGRLMYSFGFETIRRFQFLQKLKHFTNSQLTFK